MNVANRLLAVAAIAWVVLSCPWPLVAQPATPVVADTVLVNGKVWTGNPGQPEVEGIAIWRERILAIGTNATIKSLTGPQTRVIDLQGRRVVPGFHDSHVHLLQGGMRLSQVALKDAA